DKPDFVVSDKHQHASAHLAPAQPDLASTEHHLASDERLAPGERVIKLASLEATNEFGKNLAGALSKSLIVSRSPQVSSENAAAIILLSGNLGAGKTTLVQAIGRALQVKEVINSPTFTMLGEYHSGLVPLYHFDFYRVRDMQDKEEQEISLDMLAAEFDEICQTRAVICIEWPEYFLVQGENYLEQFDRLALTLIIDDDEGRRLQLIAYGRLPQDWICSTISKQT
ncbi:MAG TPA: tRNA (adenosine(37)-N6)-threonylcarbamoyltransferase complex ATPase subunit type 1 TsaE, partial [Nitrososphaera sp.]|nr:tRNA (adenosine(37)-N6)-threonylcarbamoyltransferase complex ATPase subunit type 1 TsaE [Nitrososphaera sp.]